MQQGGQLLFQACSTAANSAAATSRGGVEDCWDEERFCCGQGGGLVIFDGGSYSLGPETVGM